MQHFYHSVPGWAAFTGLYENIVREMPAGQPHHFVEVGSWLGRSAVFMAVEIKNSGKDIRFDCIDPWDDGGPDLRHKVAKMDIPIYEQFIQNVSPVREFIKPIRLPSLEGAKLYEDGTLDFVMIDGSHQYDDVKADIEAWFPKVRPGGVLSGDDYNWGGVKRAVDELVSGALVVEVPQKKKTLKKTPAYWWFRK